MTAPAACAEYPASKMARPDGLQQQSLPFRYTDVARGETCSRTSCFRLATSWLCPDAYANPEWVSAALPAVAGVGLLGACRQWRLRRSGFSIHAAELVQLTTTISVSASIRGQEIDVYGPTLDAQVTARKEARAWSIEATPRWRRIAHRMQNRRLQQLHCYFDTRGETTHSTREVA